MVDPVTANIGLAQPTRGSDVGTWDTPVNGNSTILDAAVGGVLTIGLNASNVILSSAQFIYRAITFNSTLTASVTITFPSTFKKDYIIKNVCTGSSAFTITLQTTVAGAAVIACRPGNPFVCYNDGTNLSFVNLGTEIGGYWDYAGSSVPSWVSGCTVPPYLNCDGTTFSAAVYPSLNVILGGNTLPNSKGRYRVSLDQGTGNISSATGLLGVGTTGGSQTMGSSNLPANIPIKDPGHFHTYNAPSFPGSGTVVPPGTGGPNLTTLSTNTSISVTNITVNPSTGVTGAPLLPPSYVGGLTLIRAA